MSSYAEKRGSDRPGNKGRDNEKKVNSDGRISHEKKSKKNGGNRNSNSSKQNNYLLFPPTNVNPGNIGAWKRRITAELKEKAHMLACFTETG